MLPINQCCRTKLKVEGELSLQNLKGGSPLPPRFYSTVIDTLPCGIKNEQDQTNSNDDAENDCISTFSQVYFLHQIVECREAT